MSRPRSFVAATVAAVALVGLASGANAANGRHTVRLDVTTIDGPVSVTGASCDPAGRCVIGYTVASDVEGDMEGTLAVTGTAFVDPATGDSRATLLGLFDGTVSGCGADQPGTFVVWWPLVAGSPAAPFSGPLEVVEDSGSGALAGISGRGTFEATIDPTTGGSISRWELRLRCAVG
jgi:hypothetical protein